MDTSTIRDRTDRLAVRWVPTTIAWLAGLLWLSSVSWKVPPDFGETADRCSRLCGFVQDGIAHPVVPPAGWILDNVVEPQLALFGWITLLTEAALAALLISGRHLRVAAVLGVAQSLAIGLTVANGPGEWYWAYLLMVGLHLAVLSYAPVLRPTSPRTLAAVVGLYAIVVAVAHAGAGFTGGGDDPWTRFGGGNDIPDELGRGTFPGSIALGLAFVGLAAVIWALAGAAPRTRATGGHLLVAAAVVLLLTYRNDGLAIGLGSRAATTAVLAAAGLALTTPSPDRRPARSSSLEGAR
jgi:hypothetical protein